MLITGFDCVRVSEPDVAATTALYERFLGVPAVDGRLQLSNCAVEVVGGASGIEVVLATSDVAAAERRLQRRGVESVTDAAPGTMQRDGFRFGLAGATAPEAGDRADLYAVDHVVVHTPDPQRAVALFGGRLGLDLRLERHAPQWGSHMLFFRCGDAVLEVVHRFAEDTDPSVPDVVWGTAWRSHDIAATHTRLRAAGFEVTDPKDGRKPGTTVMTVRAPLPVPTLVIGRTP